MTIFIIAFKLPLQVVSILGADRVVYTDNGIAQTGGEGGPLAKTEAANPGTLRSALLDMALLSRCHDLVVTQVLQSLKKTPQSLESLQCGCSRLMVLRWLN